MYNKNVDATSGKKIVLLKVKVWKKQMFQFFRFGCIVLGV